MVHYVHSLEEIEGLDAAHEDVVVVGLQRLADAPAALQLLLDHHEDGSWRVVNLPQMTVASTVAGLLFLAERRIGQLWRAMGRMADASHVMQDVGLTMQQHWVAAVQAIGVRGVLVAQADGIGHLDGAHQEMSALVDDVAVARAHPFQGWEEDQLLGEMEQALTTLLDVNRTVHRRVGRLAAVVASLQRFQEQPAGWLMHALSRIDPQLLQITATVRALTADLLAQLDAANEGLLDIVHMHRQEVHNLLSMPFGVNHDLFSGQAMEVRSLRDLDDVFAVATEQHAEAGFPALTVRLRGLNVLCDANTMGVRITDGIQLRGVIVQGLNALTRAQALDASLVALGPVVKRLRDRDVINPLGVILAPEVITIIEEQAHSINTIMFDGHGQKVVCAEAGQLVSLVDEAVEMARSADPDLRDRVNILVTILGLTRRAQVFFQEEEEPAP